MTLSSVIDCLPTLRKLSRAKTLREQRKILDGCKRSCIHCAISEISHILLDNIPLSDGAKRSLRQYKAKLRSLNKKESLLSRERRLYKKGKGFYHHYQSQQSLL